MEATVEASSAPWVLRDFAPGDEAFIFATWLRSYRASRIAGALEPELYFFEQQKVIARLLKSADVRVASSPDEARQIFGWIVGKRPDARPPAIAVVHYLFVKGEYLEMGLGRKLLAEIVPPAGASVFFTHMPPATSPVDRNGRKQRLAGHDVLKHLAPNAVYNPYLAFR